MTDNTSQSQLYLPTLGDFYARVSELGYPLIRFVAGIMIVPHGMQKLFGAFGGAGLGGTINFFDKIGLHPAAPLVYLVVIVEFLGGLCIALGLLTRFWAAAIAIEMAYIVFFMKWSHGFFAGKGGFEYELMWGLVALAIALRGSGKYSIDSSIGKEL